MIVDVVRLRREGRKLSPHEARATSPLRGELVIVTRPWRQVWCPNEAYVPTTLAHLWPALAQQNDLLPMLHDARMRRLEANQLVLVGVETLGAWPIMAEYPQAWWCRTVA